MTKISRGHAGGHVGGHLKKLQATENKELLGLVEPILGHVSGHAGGHPTLQAIENTEEKYPPLIPYKKGFPLKGKPLLAAIAFAPSGEMRDALSLSIDADRASIAA